MIKNRRKKRAITLLELLIVISLIAMALSILGISAPRFLGNETFFKSVERFQAKVDLAHELMLEYNSDLLLHLSLSEKGLHCTLTPLGSISRKTITLANQHSDFEGITEMHFNGIPLQSLQCEFCAATCESTRGTLLFKSKYQQCEIFLSGYPQRAKSKNLELSKAPYPEELVK